MELKHLWWELKYVVCLDTFSFAYFPNLAIILYSSAHGDSLLGNFLNDNLEGIGAFLERIQIYPSRTTANFILNKK